MFDILDKIFGKSKAKHRHLTPAESFIKSKFVTNTDKDCYPETSAAEGLNVLINHFLGKDWYCVDHISTTQVNTVAVHEILKRYKGVD